MAFTKFSCGYYDKGMKIFDHFPRKNTAQEHRREPQKTSDPFNCAQPLKIFVFGACSIFIKITFSILLFAGVCTDRVGATRSQKQLVPFSEITTSKTSIRTANQLLEQRPPSMPTWISSAEIGVFPTIKFYLSTCWTQVGMGKHNFRTSTGETFRLIH